MAQFETLDTLIGNNRIDNLVKFFHHFGIDDVHGTVRTVPRDECDAIGIGFQLKMYITHD